MPRFWFKLSDIGLWILSSLHDLVTNPASPKRENCETLRELRVQGIFQPCELEL